jgi:hypothetical protein
MVSGFEGPRRESHCPGCQYYISPENPQTIVDLLEPVLSDPRQDWDVGAGIDIGCGVELPRLIFVRIDIPIYI